MPNQTARQQARRAALDAQTRMRQARAEQERRRSALAVTVVTALAERDALVTACEARAGERNGEARALCIRLQHKQKRRRPGGRRREALCENRL